MGVFIKDMKMPMECNDCPLANFNMGTMYCKAVPHSPSEGYKRISFSGKRDDCPLIEVEEVEE